MHVCNTEKLIRHGRIETKITRLIFECMKPDTNLDHAGLKTMEPPLALRSIHGMERVNKIFTAEYKLDQRHFIWMAKDAYLNLY